MLSLWRRQLEHGLPISRGVQNTQNVNFRSLEAVKYQVIAESFDRPDAQTLQRGMAHWFSGAEFWIGRKSREGVFDCGNKPDRSVGALVGNMRDMLPHVFASRRFDRKRRHDGLEGR